MATPFDKKDIEEKSIQYSLDGFVTFGENWSSLSDERSFLEDIVGISLEDARTHLDNCVLYGVYDLAKGNDEVKPTKIPPKSYAAELIPLIEAQRSPPEKEENGSNMEKNKRILGKPRRTLHAIDVHLCDSVFKKLAESPQIGELVGALTGWTAEGVGVRLLETQVWMKPPRCTVPLAFHRDTPYFGFLSPLDICTVWLTFDDVSTIDRAKLLGGLEYARGSHLWSQRGGIEGVFFDKDYRSPMKKAALEHNSEIRNSHSSTATLADTSDFSTKIRANTEALFDLHYVLVSAGGVSFHNGMLWHGSGSNCSETEWRRGIGIHYIRSDAGFKPEYAAYDEPFDSSATAKSGDTDSSAKSERPFLSSMWAPHKKKGTLSLDSGRFPVIWPLNF